MSGFISRSYDRISQKISGEEPAKSKRGVTSAISPGTAPLSHMNIGSKWSYSTLEYPMDIQQRSDLGHYMMFYVNVVDSNRSGYSTYNGYEERKSEAPTDFEEANEVPTEEQSQTLSPAQNALRQEQKFSTGTQRQGVPGSKPKVVGRKHYQGRLAKTLKAGKNRTVRTTDSVVLYMPSTIQTNTNAVYKSPEMGNLASTLGGAAATIWSRSQELGIWGAVKEGLPGFGDMAIEDIQRAIAKVGSAIVGGDIAGAADKMSNRAQNRFLESLFDAVGFRKFSYSFKFTPKNVEESFEARKIIKLFRFHMSPELPDDDLGRYFIPPAEFDLFYMFRGEENTWLNKISSCVLTNMDVNYANGRYQTFRPISRLEKGSEGAPPIEIDMKLDFMETRIITKKEVEEGY